MISLSVAEGLNGSAQTLQGGGNHFTSSNIVTIGKTIKATFNKGGSSTELRNLNTWASLGGNVIIAWIPMMGKDAVAV